MIFIDNTTALFSFVKGCSGHRAVERAVQFFHFCAFFSNCRCWLEFVKSEDNWSDGISRNGLDDIFASSAGFSLGLGSVPPTIWSGEIYDAWELARRTVYSSLACV